MSQELALPNALPSSIQISENLRRVVNNKVMDIERSIVINRQKKAKVAAGAREAVKKEVQNRIKDNQAACKAAELCVRGIDDTVKETGLWITKLHHERYKQFAALQVCERRIQLRECNPPEFAGDSLAEALNMEQKILKEARDKFMALEKDVEQVVKELDYMRAELSKDAAHRRLAVTADQAILVNVALSSAVAAGARELASAEEKVHIDTHDGKDSYQLCQESRQLEEKAAELRNQSKQCISKMRAECTEANKRVEKRLTKRTEQTLAVTKQLIGQGKEVDYTIMQAERSLSLNHKFLDKRDQKQQQTYQATQDMMNELRRSRSQVSHDLRQRTILLTTSEACRKVTAQVAASPPPDRLVRRPATTGGQRGRTNSSFSNGSRNGGASMPKSPSLPAIVTTSPPPEPSSGQAAAMPEITLPETALPEVPKTPLPEATPEPQVQDPASFEGGADNAEEKAEPAQSE